MDRPARTLSFEELLAQSDFVSLHVPLTPETRHYINAQSLRLMKPNAILVNTSRGPVVDTMALYEALKAGQIFAAGLDVTDLVSIKAAIAGAIAAAAAIGG